MYPSSVYNYCFTIPSTSTNCNNGTVSNSVFTCTACNSGYYLNGSTCVAINQSTN